MCKMMISPGFIIFWEFCFFGLLGGGGGVKGQKIVQKEKHRLHPS